MLELKSFDWMSFVTDLHSDGMRTSILPVSYERKLSLIIKDVRKFMFRHSGLKKEDYEETIHNKASTNFNVSPCIFQFNN